MDDKNRKPHNKLIDEKSPYLLQHAFNPVQWYPWGEEAFQKARDEQKPIFLSIGYSTCHWCHVMERESFENVATAELMNRNFVNIKVDREEMPDVDRVYMSAVQAMTGSGGWPLSVFLTPDLKPFYGGTYFPPRDTHGRPGFPTVLERIHQVWRKERQSLEESGDQVIGMLKNIPATEPAGSEMDESILDRAFHHLAAGYDSKYAGFGTGPKFPRPAALHFLFRYYARTKKTEALSMALATLKAMAAGGMYDHLGGGFHRYSVDRLWRVPHFEKMLYDQAQLISSYLDAYQLKHDDFFSTIARETMEYVLRDITDVDGGFYSAEDADSPDPMQPSRLREGAFYVWRQSEADAFLTPEESRMFCHYFGIDPDGNVPSDPFQEFTEQNILFIPFTVEQTAQHLALSVQQIRNVLSSAKQKLLAVRQHRPRPRCDDKILAAWNGLMISAAARASRVLYDRRYAAAAVRAAESLWKRLYRQDTKTLYRRYRDGESKYSGKLDDYACVIQGLLDLYEATFDPEYIRRARELHGSQVALFWDTAEGGFYDTDGHDPSILVRSKETYDGAEPAGNSIAMMNLIRLHRLTDEDSFRTMVEKYLLSLSAALHASPQNMPQLLSAVDTFLSAPQHIILVEGSDVSEAEKFHRAAADSFLPNATLIVLKTSSQKEFFRTSHPFMKSMEIVDGKTTAYVCRNHRCELPTTAIATFVEQIHRPFEK